MQLLSLPRLQLLPLTMLWACRIVLACEACAVFAACEEAGLAPHDCCFVQIKCPLLTPERVRLALADGYECATSDGYHSMALSRGASALGVALATGELQPGPPSPRRLRATLQRQPRRPSLAQTRHS